MAQHAYLRLSERNLIKWHGITPQISWNSRYTQYYIQKVVVVLKGIYKKLVATCTRKKLRRIALYCPGPWLAWERERVVG